MPRKQVFIYNLFTPKKDLFAKKYNLFAIYRPARPQEDAIHARSLAIAQVHMVAYETLASRNGTLRRITQFARSTLARSYRAVFARNVASARSTTHTMAFAHYAMAHRTITHGALAIHGSIAQHYRGEPVHSRREALEFWSGFSSVPGCGRSVRDENITYRNQLFM